LGSEVLDIVRESKPRRYSDIVFVDDAAPPHGIIHGIRVIGARSSLSELRPGSVDLCVATGNPAARLELTEFAQRYGHSMISVIDPTALVRSSATVEEGTIIGARAVVSSNASIGAHAAINIGAVIGHGVSIGRYAVIGAGALISGGARVGEGALIGAGASILLGTVVGSWSTVAMGAAVFTEVAAETTVFGNPARVIMPVRLAARGESR
jgi:sugar O-acyltransferase (sialic acid O-acetyltransferase NeuD family)